MNNNNTMNNVAAANPEEGIEMNKTNNIEVVNLTPHAINIVGGPTFEPSGEVARISSTNESVGELVINGELISLITQEFGEIIGLPEEKEGTLFIVSGLIFSNSSRKDLLVPGEQVRDEQGRVIGCKSFQVREGIEVAPKEENIKSYTFNNRQGKRDRQVAAGVWNQGQTYTLNEAEEAKLASIVTLDSVSEGKWSNKTMRVVVKSATLVVFREPFEGWSEDKETALEQARKSAQEYLGENISHDVLWDVIKRFFPRKSSYMKTAEEQGWSLM